MLFASLPPAKISMWKSGGLLRKVTLLVEVDGLAEVAVMTYFVAVSNLLLRMETSLVAVDGLEEVWVMTSFVAADALEDANLLHAAIVLRNFLCSFLL